MKKVKLPVPTEFEEACVLADYLRLKGYLFSHIPSETFTQNWGTKIKNKRQGVNRGVPDYLIIVPSNKAPQSHLLFIELKRKKNSVISKEQKGWLTELNQCQGVYCSIAFGADEAIKFIETIK